MKIQMKKYTSQQINSLSWQEWNELMAKELNAAGYKAKEFDGRKWVRTGYYKADSSDPAYFSLELDEDGLDYLKEIGLVNNGRCLQCGNPIYGNPGRFTDGFNHNFHYQICQNCVRTRGGMLPNNGVQQGNGCMAALLLLPVNLIASLFTLIR